MEAELFGHERGRLHRREGVARWASSRRRRAASSFSTRWATSSCRSRASCSRRWRSAPCAGSAGSGTGRSTSGSSPPPTATSSASRSASASAATCTSAWRSSCCACPPLRERGDDVLIAGRALSPAVQRQVWQDRVERIDPRARDLLLAYPWPGNVRELSHVIERAVLWSRDRCSTSSTRARGAGPDAGRADGADRRWPCPANRPARHGPGPVGALADRAGAMREPTATRPARPSGSASPATPCATG